MGISLEQYRACIGNFNSYKLSYIESSLSLRFFFSFGGFPNLLPYRSFLFWVQYFYIFFELSLLLLAGDIESNPGPREKDNTLSISHWNLNSVWVDNFSKIAQITAFLSAHKFDIFCVGESFLNSSITNDDSSLMAV